MMRFHENQNALVLSVVEVADADLPEAGNVKVRVSVTCGGFTGRIVTWIATEGWAAYCHQLRDVERNRSGAAGLESALPGEFSFQVEIAGPGEQAKIRGSMSQHGGGNSEKESGALSFFFTFDAAQVAPAVEAVTCMSWR